MPFSTIKVLEFNKQNQNFQGKSNLNLSFDINFVWGLGNLLSETFTSKPVYSMFFLLDDNKT